MKKMIIINGTMGIGKTTTCTKLNQSLHKSVFLDADWCWLMNPFVVTDETKEMVMNNISFLLNSYLNCSEIEHVVFCWVLHQEWIIKDLIKRLDRTDYELHVVTLMCSEKELRERLLKDVNLNVRDEEIINRSLDKLKLYESMDTQKIDVSHMSVDQVVASVEEMIGVNDIENRKSNS
jgi:cytidylate kinase